MKRKDYMKPTMWVISVQATQILAGSDEQTRGRNTIKDWEETETTTRSIWM